MEVDANNENRAPAAKAKGSKSIEETYQKLSQLEHILLRPDTYIGSTERQAQTLWVHDGERMVFRSITYAPGLYKIFDEILVNAADNKVRDPSMDTLRVDIDVEKGTIKVLNNGVGIPIEVHKTEGVYVPELIFGHLLTSSNYNDNEKKVTGGRNGYGAKLANIFSKRFVVETLNSKRGRKYKQARGRANCWAGRQWAGEEEGQGRAVAGVVFTKNMTQKGEPQISDGSGDDWTAITFQPDLGRFGMAELDEDTVALMRKRVYDMAGLLGKTVKASGERRSRSPLVVFYNGQRIKVKTFQEYVDMYLGPKDAGVLRVYERFSDRWEVCLATSDGQFNQVSFVNSICTSKGGTHINYIADQARGRGPGRSVVKNLCELINKKNKTANVKPFMVKNYLWVFVNCLVENPAFDSQTKDTLTLRASAFGSKCELSDAFLKKVANCGVVDQVLSFASFKANKELKKGDGAKRQRLTGVPKLDDANDAGGRNSEHCTLILTEGDSAKSLAVAGLSVVGRDRFGVFPLRGKLLNVRDAGAAQITGNAEINNIKQILGLQHGKVYADAKSLRYGHLMIMTDQDHDGSHIKGLIMNFFHHFYPSLLKLPGFLVEFITPIIKATKGRESISFYTLPEYEQWKEATGGHGWKIKYYKGLGTSTTAEAKDYFANIASHRKQFVWSGNDDGQALEMAFSKKKVEERKDWLRTFKPGTYLDHSADEISYSDFVHKELILFSRADLERSIPCMVDGLKPGQRKIMFACFKRNLRSDIKVAQLAGYVAEHSAYHHGEASLAATIVGLAQDFVGSNNINYLVPQGQFGTRLQGGKDAASPRYIFTRMAPLTRHLFNEHDDRLLAYLSEEGQSIEPEWYMPILPTVLVNGAEGIGTGWSTSIPNYNPRDVVDNLKRMLGGEEPQPMEPWYKGFRGTITEVPTKTSGKSYQICGVINQVDETTLEITELPIRKWTQDYKEFLEEMVKPEDKNAQPFITDYKASGEEMGGEREGREYHTDTHVRFVVTLPESKMREALAAGLLDKFKLKTKISIGNMMLFNSEGAIQKYTSPEDILREFFQLRLDHYAKRKALLLASAEADLLRISNKVRFILAVVSGELRLSNRRKADVEGELEAAGYDRLANSKKKAAAAAAAADDDEEGGAPATGLSYDYLLSMPLASLTLEKVQALQSEAGETEARVETLRGTTEQDMWRSDLDAFLESLELVEADEERRGAQLQRQQAKAAKANARAQKAAAKKGKKKKGHAWSDDESDEAADSEDVMSEDEDDYVPVKKAAAARKPPAAKPAPSGATSMQVSQQSRPTAPKAPAARKPAATKPGSKPASRAASPAGSDGEGPSAAPARPVAAAKAPAAKPAPPPPPPEEEVSLMARLTQRVGTLGLNSGGPGGVAVAKPAAKPVPAAPAAKPAAAAAKPAASGRPGRAAAAAASRKASAAVRDDSNSEVDLLSSDEDEVNSPAVAPKAAAGGGRGAAAQKRAKPEPKRSLAAAAARKSSQAVEEDEFASSPVPKPASKVQRMRPTPFNKKSGVAKQSNLAGASKKPAAAKEDADSDSEVEVMDDSPALPPRAAAGGRHDAATKKPVCYKEESGSEDEESGSEESDYCPSSD
eukprot:scaffold1.g5643.t1